MAIKAYHRGYPASGGRHDVPHEVSPPKPVVRSHVEGLRNESGQRIPPKPMLDDDPYQSLWY